jgi:CAAX protease family protein
MDLFRKIFLAPGEPRLRSGWRLLGQFLLLVLVLFAIASIFTFLAQLSPIFQFLGDITFISFVAVTISVYLARHWFDRRSMLDLGLHWNGGATRDLLAGVLIAGVIMGLIFAAEWGLGWLTFSKTTTAGMPGGLGYWAAVFILVGWYEELMFRGYWLQNLREGLGPAIGLFASAAIFALAHLSNPHISLAAVLGLLAAGYFLAFGYLKTSQLWLPIGLHIGWNFFEGPIFSFPVSGLESARLLDVRVSGPELITGGAFGPEAGLIVLPALAIGAALIVWYAKTFSTSALNEK